MLWYHRQISRYTYIGLLPKTVVDSDSVTVFKTRHRRNFSGVRADAYPYFLKSGGTVPPPANFKRYKSGHLFAFSYVKHYLQHSMMDFFLCYIMTVSCKQRCYDHTPEAIFGAEIVQKCPGPRWRSLQHSPDFLARLSGPTSKGEGRGTGRGSGTPTLLGRKLCP